jgi:predicted nucleic acid-binding protein
MIGNLEFIDTNLLIYAYDPNSKEKHEMAKKLVQRLWRDETGAISIQVMQELLVNITKKIAQPLSWQEAVNLLEDLQTWTVHSPTSKNVLNAAQHAIKHQFSLWDAMILESATSLECQILWSEDLNHGQKFGNLRIQNPFKEL